MNILTESDSLSSDPSAPTADATTRPPVVTTFTGKRGAIVRRSPAGTPPDLARVYVRLDLVVGKPTTRRPARVIVAYRPRDVREVRR
jgi:hypothetical protein